MPQATPLDRLLPADRLLGPRFSPAPNEKLCDLACRLSRTLALARALIQSGRTLDLTGVEDGVGLLCAQTLDLPLGDARALLPALHELLAQLDQVVVAVHGSIHTGTARC